MTHKSRPISVAIPVDLCGIGSWSPEWMQRLATPKVFLFVFGMIGVIQGANYTYIVASITTLEKRYAFGSKVTALILISHTLMELICNPLFGYLANRVHRPRMIGYSQLVVGLGCYLAALPYFIYGPGVNSLGSTQALTPTSYSSHRSIEFCGRNSQVDSDCSDNSSSNTIIPAVILLLLCICCNGIGSVAFATIGIPFIDDSVKKRNSPIYLGLTGCLRLCGPTFGFILSSLCLRFYENPFIDPGIENVKDPRWIGAWWVGFIVIGTGTLLASIPMFLFPRQFKNTINIKPNTLKPLLKANKSIDQTNDFSLWNRIIRLLKNPIYMCYIVGTTARLFAVLGYVSFKSKYIESEYKVSASSSNFFSGLIGVVPSALGIFLGGLFIRQFQPGPRILTSFITIVEILGVLGIFSALFLGCRVSQFSGTQINTNFEMHSMCNNNCFCTEKIFQPICGPDKIINYFSPCFAGCKTQSLIQNTNKPNQYSNCGCFTGEATEGYCANDCNTFKSYVILMGFSNIIGYLAQIGNSIIQLRIVEARDKSFALGMMSAFFCVFAFIPYPLVFGAVTDSTCLVWENRCGKRGNCWIYDTIKFRHYLHGLTLGLYFTGSLFDIIVIFLSSRIKNLYSDEEEVKTENDIKLKLRNSNDKNLSQIFEF